MLWNWLAYSIFLHFRHVHTIYTYGALRSVEIVSGSARTLKKRPTQPRARAAVCVDELVGTGGQRVQRPQVDTTLLVPAKVVTSEPRR